MSPYGGRLLARVVRVRFAVIALLALLFTAYNVIDSWSDGIDWPLLTGGGSTLWSRNAAHLYVANHGLQAGPLSLVFVGLFLHLFGTAAGLVVRLLLVGELPLLVWVAERTATELGNPADRHQKRIPLVGLLAGVVLTPVWGVLAGQTLHLDDGMALLAALATVLFVARDRGTVAAVCAGCAVASKPWAFGALAVLAGLHRGRLRALAVAAGVSVVGWTVMLVDPHNISAASNESFDVSRWVPLHAFGLASGVAPAWQRPVELVAIAAAAAVAACRGDWVSAFAASMVARLFTEIALLGYYDVDAIVGVFAADVALRRLPWRSLLLWVLVEIVPFLSLTSTAEIRCAILSLLLASYLFPAPARLRMRVAARWAALRPLLAS